MDTEISYIVQSPDTPPTGCAMATTVDATSWSEYSGLRYLSICSGAHRLVASVSIWGVSEFEVWFHAVKIITFKSALSF